MAGWQRRRWWLAAGMLASYALVAVVITWPLATVMSTRLFGHPFGDHYEYIRHIWWLKQALETGQPLFFQPLLAYPDGLAGAWLGATWLQSFPAVLLAFVMPLPAAYNLTLLLYLTLNGAAMAVFVWRLSGQGGAAWLAGLIYLTFPTFQGQMGASHLGLLAAWGAPLWAFLLTSAPGPFSAGGEGIRTDLALSLQQPASRTDVPPRRAPRPWAVVVGAVVLVVSVGGSPLLGLYLVGPVTLAVLGWLAARHEWAALRRALVMIGLGALLWLPLGLPALGEETTGWGGGDLRYSLDGLGLVTPSYLHPLWGQMEHTHRVLGSDPFERVGYVGLVTAGLAVVAVLAGRRRGAWPWLALAAGAWLLALGPVWQWLGAPVMIRPGGTAGLIPLPAAALLELPFVGETRTWARFSFSIAFALAMLAGLGAAALLPRLPGRWRGAALALAGALIVWDTLFFWEGGRPVLPTDEGVVPAEIIALAETEARAVLSIPWAHPLVDKEALFLQTGHGKPLIAGHVMRETPVDPARLTLLEETLDPALLTAAGADLIILHRWWAADAEAEAARLRAAFGAPVWEGERWAVWKAGGGD